MATKRRRAVAPSVPVETNLAWARRTGTLAFERWPWGLRTRPRRQRRRLRPPPNSPHSDLDAGRTWAAVVAALVVVVVAVADRRRPWRPRTQPLECTRCAASPVVAAAAAVVVALRASWASVGVVVAVACACCFCSARS